ncbi:MAG: glycosyltransferase domain-containing protein [Candidatus Eremiobacterota bacterium]
MGFLRNTLFDTYPVVVHAHGSHSFKPQWPPIRERLFRDPPATFRPCADLTVITCNNGHESMGLFERSLERAGLSCTVLGQGVEPWVNSRNKPPLLLEAALAATTPYLLYADSRDAVLIDDPARAVEVFRATGCGLLFGGDRMSWPALPAFRRFEQGLDGARDSDFRYLNGGTWIGRREFVVEFFREACRTPPVPEAPESEQGILRQLFPRFYPEVRLDYRCQVFQNVGFVPTSIFELT